MTLGSNPNLDSHLHGIGSGFHHHNHYGHHFDGAYKSKILTKSFFRDILSAHYKQPDLKVTLNSTWITLLAYMVLPTYCVSIIPIHAVTS